MHLIVVDAHTVGQSSFPFLLQQKYPLIQADISVAGYMGICSKLGNGHFIKRRYCFSIFSGSILIHFYFTSTRIVASHFGVGNIEYSAASTPLTKWSFFAMLISLFLE